MSVLPREEKDYLNAAWDKHAPGGVGSIFTKVRSFPELLSLAKEQRGSLDGDDRDWFIKQGVPENALLPDCRYLRVKTPGEIGIIRLSEVKDDEEIMVERLKPGAPCTLYVERNTLPKTNFATIVIGPNENPNPSTNEMVWTAHPGLPVRPASKDKWTEGTKMKASELKSLGDAWINVKKV